MKSTIIFKKTHHALKPGKQIVKFSQPPRFQKDQITNINTRHSLLDLSVKITAIFIMNSTMILAQKYNHLRYYTWHTTAKHLR